MIATIITVALAIFIGMCFLHMTYTYGVMKGYEQGLDDVEQMIREVQDEEVLEHRD